MEFIKTKDEIAESISQNIINNTPIDTIEPASVIGGLVESFSREIEQEYLAYNSILNKTNLSSASGKDLDKIGEMFNIFRKQSNYAYADNIVVSIKDGSKATFDINIPKGSVITGRNENGDEIDFIVIEDAIIAAGTNSTTISMRAKRTGAEYNLPPASLHSITYPGTIELSVYNPSTIYTGSDEESDINYRYRIMKSRDTLAKGTIEAISQAILSIEGISDIVVVNDIDTTIYIKTTSVNPSNFVLQEAQLIADSYSAYGHNVYVKEPKKLYVHLTVHVNDANSSSREILYSIAKNYINNLDMGESLSLSELETILRTQVKDIVDQTKSNIFAEAYYTKDLYGWDNNYPITRIAKASKHERFILQSLEVK